MMTDSNGPKTYTPEQREFVQEVYAGADEAGVQIAGITNIQRVEDALGGNKDAPVKIGQQGSVTVRVGEDGKLLPPRGFSDEAATSILQIDVHADRFLDSNGDTHVRYIAYVKQHDTATTRQMENSKSGPSSSDWIERTARRPDQEASDDAAFKDWVVESMADSAGEAVRQALTPLVVGANQLRSGRLEPAPTEGNADDVPVTTLATAADDVVTEPRGGVPWWLTGVGALVVFAMLVGLGIWLWGGSDEDAVVSEPIEVVSDDTGDATEEAPVEEEDAGPVTTAPAATPVPTATPVATTTPPSTAIPVPTVAAVTVDDLIDGSRALVAADSGHLTSNGSLVDVVDGAPALEMATSVFQDSGGRVYYVVEGPRDLVESSSWEWDALAGGRVVSETSLIGTSPQPAPSWVYETPNGSVLTHVEFPINVDTDVVIGVICTDTVIGDGSETSSNWNYFPAGDGEHDFVHFTVDLASVPTVSDGVIDAVSPPTAPPGTVTITWVAPGDS
jgi:hypothetical protein